MTVFLDTNILLYAAFRPGEGDEDKRETARRLLERNDCVLSAQVLIEFVNQAMHPRRAERLGPEEAMEYLVFWQTMPVQDMTFAIVHDGLRILSQHRLQWWDCLIVAAALARGCEILYTEDMQDGRIIDGLRIVNPFA